MKVHFILYVANQALSTDFYRKVLGVLPILDVPGMTEFVLADGVVLGLMPEEGIKKLIGRALPDPKEGRGAPRAEMYLLVNDPMSFHQRAIENGARELSALEAREWGHSVAYSLDPDGHVLAFAQEGAATAKCHQ